MAITVKNNFLDDEDLQNLFDDKDLGLLDHLYGDFVNKMNLFFSNYVERDMILIDIAASVQELLQNWRHCMIKYEDLIPNINKIIFATADKYPETYKNKVIFCF